MTFELQPRLHNDLIRLEPLAAGDLEQLYAVAADPLIWEQHPNPNRYQRAAFENYFKGAIESGGAFRVIDQATGETIGSSRFCSHNKVEKTIDIGYTFIARSRWGGGYNRAMKTLMLDHAFGFVDRVIFQVGINNKRSRAAMVKLGAVHIGDAEVSYYGEASTHNVIYAIDRADWVGQQPAAG